MTCDRIRPLLSAHHDDALSAADGARIRAHLATCAACRRTLTSYGELYQAVRAASAPVPLDLRRNIYARIAREERAQRIGFPAGATLLRGLRAVGGTAALLAVLALLVLAASRLQGTAGQETPRVAAAVERMAVGQVLGAARDGGASNLPAAAQTQVAPLRGSLAAIASPVVATSPGSNRISVKMRFARFIAGNAKAVFLVQAAFADEGGAPVLKGITVGRPSSLPNIGGDGLAYLRLDTDCALTTCGNSPAEVEWHAFAPGATPRVLATPGPFTEQLFTGLTASTDGRRLAFSALGEGKNGGVYSLDLANPRPVSVLPFPDIAPPNVGTQHVYVRQVYPLQGGGLLATIITDTAMAKAMSEVITTPHGLSSVVSNDAPWSWSDYIVSPNRRSIAVVTHPGPHGYGLLQVAPLRTSSTSSGSASETRTIGVGAHPVWSPDSARIMYKSPNGLFAWSARDGRSTRLARLNQPSQPFISGFTWAPDSRLFVVVKTTLDTPKAPGTSEVWLGDVETPGYTWPSFKRRFIGSLAWTRAPAPATPIAVAPASTPSPASRIGAPTITAAPPLASSGAQPLSAPASTTHISTLDGAAPPASVLERYYDAVNRRDYKRAFGYNLFLPGDQPDYARFAQGYAATSSTRLTRLTSMPYLNTANSHATTCLGFELAARQLDGTIRRYGGWYMLARGAGQNHTPNGWRIVMSGSRSVLGSRATVPPQGKCALPGKRS